MCPLVGVVGVWVVRRGAGARHLELVRIQGLLTSHSLMGGGERRERGGEGRGRGGEEEGRERRGGGEERGRKG